MTRRKRDESTSAASVLELRYRRDGDAIVDRRDGSILYEGLTTTLNFTDEAADRLLQLCNEGVQTWPLAESIMVAEGIPLNRLYPNPRPAKVIEEAIAAQQLVVNEAIRLLEDAIRTDYQGEGSIAGGFAIEENRRAAVIGEEAALERLYDEMAACEEQMICPQNLFDLEMHRCILAILAATSPAAAPQRRLDFDTLRGLLPELRRAGRFAVSFEAGETMAAFVEELRRAPDEATAQRLFAIWSCLSFVTQAPIHYEVIRLVSEVLRRQRSAVLAG